MKLLLNLFIFHFSISQFTFSHLSENSIFAVEKTFDNIFVDSRIDLKTFIGHENDIIFNIIDISIVNDRYKNIYISSNTLFNSIIYLSFMDSTFKDNLPLKIVMFIPFLTNAKFGAIQENGGLIFGQNTDYYLFYENSEVYTETILQLMFGYKDFYTGLTYAYCWNGAYIRKEGSQFRFNFYYRIN